MKELRRIIGQEQPLDQFHLILRRAAALVPGISDYGCCLVTCSDERQGTTRGGFERDVAMPLISDVANPRDRVFSVSNLCGRLEPGGFALIDDHFNRTGKRGRRLLLIEIASHVGRIRRDTQHYYGQIERFGRASPCCGALTSLLKPRAETGAVRHPWFEQLNSFFGQVRLETLRGLDESRRMIAAAIVHAGLQGESTITEIFDEPPTTPTDILVVAGVSVNQQWADGFLPVAYHHLRTEADDVRIVSGFGLRSTPEALAIDIGAARIHVDGGEQMERARSVRRREPEAALAAEEAIEAIAELSDEQREDLNTRLDEVRSRIDEIRHDPTALRTYARPILRGLFRGLCVAQPELGLAALVYEGGADMIGARRLRQILAAGPSTSEGRRVLHDIEAELQQLNHEDAQQVLDLLLAQKH